jgi:hypothetical protein
MIMVNPGEPVKQSPLWNAAACRCQATGNDQAPTRLLVDTFKS